MSQQSDAQHKALDQQVKDLLAELYLSDPTLKENERALELLVHEMLLADPKAEPTHAFVGHLRDHLIHHGEHRVSYELEKAKAQALKPKKPHGVAFWTFRFVPLGVVVAVVIMLYVVPKAPDLVNNPPQLPHLREGTSGGESTGNMKTEGYDTSSIPADWNPTPQAPTASIVFTGSRPGAEAFVSVVMPRAGYVAIYTEQGGRPGRFLGVSRLLPPGPTDNERILLSPGAIQGETLYAELRESNGDIRFDPLSDPQVYGTNGSVVSAHAYVSN